MFLRYNQKLIFFCAFHIIRIYKKFLFRVCSILFHNVVERGFFLVRLHRVFIESEYLDVGSGKYFSAANQPSIIIILKILVYGVMVFRVCLLCFVFWVLLIEWLRGLFVVIV